MNNILNAITINSSVAIDSTTYIDNDIAEINLNAMPLNTILNAVTMNSTVTIDSTTFDDKNTQETNL